MTAPRDAAPSKMFHKQPREGLFYWGYRSAGILAGKSMLSEL